MERRLMVLTIPVFLAAVPARAQDGGLSVVLKGNYTTSAQIFPNPNASDPFARSQSFSLEDFLGGGVEVRYRIPGSTLAFGVSVDRIAAETQRVISSTTGRGVPVDDGYSAIPVELTGYFIIPVSTEQVGIFMGGGAGVYFGRRTYRVAGVEAPVVSTSPGFGIHVLAGLSYSFTEWFSLVGEMKFRDLQFTSSNAFSVPRITYNGAVITVGQDPFASRVNTDGIVFQLGAAYTL
jgi:hypothetical protein